MFRTVALIAICAQFSGCAMFGIVRRAPILQVNNDTVAAAAGVDMTAVILRAASGRKWATTVTAPDVVRCQFYGRSWSIEVDVRHSGPTFSITYVSSEGLFYRPEFGDIHVTYNKQVEALRQRIKREALRAPAAVIVQSVTPVSATPVSAGIAATPAAKPYVIKEFARESGDSFAYRFVLAITDASSADLSLSRRIQADLREVVRADYAAAYGMKDAATLRIEFSQYAIVDGKVEGRAVVMSVELLEFVYDPDTMQGRLAVKVNPRQYEVTRQWVRSNIATLARDKDPSLLNAFAGRSRFTIGREVLRDDNVLEVEFKMGD